MHIKGAYNVAAGLPITFPGIVPHSQQKAHSDSENPHGSVNGQQTRLDIDRLDGSVQFYLTSQFAPSTPGRTTLVKNSTNNSVICLEGHHYLYLRPSHVSFVHL